MGGRGAAFASPVTAGKEQAIDAVRPPATGKAELGGDDVLVSTRGK